VFVQSLVQQVVIVRNDCLHLRGDLTGQHNINSGARCTLVGTKSAAFCGQSIVSRRPHKEEAISTYVVLYKFTDAGAKNVKGTVQRARESRAENEQRGFTVHGLYWT
jgi:hypothetical protein